MTTLLRNKTVMGTSFRIFEAHIPYPLQFFIDYKIYGMGYVNFSLVKFRLPLPRTHKHRHIDLNESTSRLASQGALFSGIHLDSTVGPELYLHLKKDTRSELEVDVDVSHIIEPSSGPSISPNVSGMKLPQQLVPSLTYMWEDERRRRYEAAKSKNPFVSPDSQSLGLGSIFDSSHERLVDVPHDFHRSILDRFRKLVEKDDRDAQALLSDPVPLQSSQTPSHSLGDSALKRMPVLNSTPMATTGYRQLTERANQLLSDDAFFRLASSQQIIGSQQVDEELASSQQSDESLLEALQWMQEDDWNNLEWETRVGRESDGFGVVNNEEEERMMDDKEVEAILASQREVTDDHQQQADDILPPPPSRVDGKKRDHADDPSSSLEYLLLEQLAPKPKKRVQFVEITHVLLYNEDDLHPHSIEERLLNFAKESKTAVQLETTSGDESQLVDQASSPPSSRDDLPSPAAIPHPSNSSTVSPPKEIPETQQSQSSIIKPSSQDPDFQLEEQRFSSSSSASLPFSSPSPSTPKHRPPDMIDSKVLSIPYLTKLASNSIASKFSKSFASRRLSVHPHPLKHQIPSHSPHFTHLHQSSNTSASSDPQQQQQQLALLPWPSPLADLPVQSSVIASNDGEKAETLLLPPPELELEALASPSFSVLKSPSSPRSKSHPQAHIPREDVKHPSSANNEHKSEERVEQQEQPPEHRHLVLKFHRDPPSWDDIVAGMKRRDMPLLRYQAPYYGNALDKPAKASKFAGISINVESVQFDALPPFCSPPPPPPPPNLPTHNTSWYHHIGSERQHIKKKGVRGLALRALTPARPPPVVHLYSYDQGEKKETIAVQSELDIKESKKEDVEQEDDDEDYELVANSPKLAEQFRLVAGVRPIHKSSTASSSSGPNIQTVLEEDNQSRRRAPPSFESGSQQQLLLASQIDRSTPSNPHGFALRPEARRNLGGMGTEGLTMLSMEVFSTSNGPMRPNPLICPVEAIYYCIRDDFEIRSVGAANYSDQRGVLCLKRSPSSSSSSSSSFADATNVTRHEYHTETELLIAFRDIVVMADPDIVMGYECQQSSLGYVFERALRLGIPKYIPSFGRASGELGNQFETAGDSWGYQHASGISMVGRIVFNVWRIMRSELALQSYSFESIAYHVLHQRIPHFDHITLTKWYTGLSDLGPATKIASKSTADSKPPSHPPSGPPSKSQRKAHSQQQGDDSDQMDVDDTAEMIEQSQAPEHVDSNQPDVDSKNILDLDDDKIASHMVSEGKRETTSNKSATDSDKGMESALSKRSWPFATDRWRVDSYYLKRAQCNFYMLDALNIISRTSEFARMYGITFYSVLSRGSQYRVESLMLRMTKPQNFVCVSPTRQQVAQQLAPESIPLVMEPLSAFYTDPVLVLDFQSLYPSVIIAYNLCFSTCLGKIGTLVRDGGGGGGDGLPSASVSKRLGVLNYELPVGLISSLKDDIYCAANGVMYVKPELRTGTMPRMLHEILETRVMVKESMKSVKKNDPLVWSMLDSRQLGLKMIANVTYGYASASFSGRMPCVDLADSIVQTGRETLERAINLINSTKEWGSKVVYGDTDSVFVLLKGATKKRAFEVGAEISRRVTDDNPWPVKLKFEKCYHPCVLLAKKRYVGYMYESVEQEVPIFDAKGIETVRRDTCPAVSKILEKCLRMLFELKDMSIIKSYLRTQWTKILTGRVSLLDFIFRKEVRLGTYRGHHAPPAALVAMKEVDKDPRAAPRYGERVPYVVVNGTPKSKLVDLVFHPLSVVSPDSGMFINANYYITRNIIPVLSRVFDLFGVSIADWYNEMPKRLRSARSSHLKLSEAEIKLRRQTIDHYYTSQYCPICDALTSKTICEECLSKPAMAAYILASRIKEKNRKRAHLLELCMQCSDNHARTPTIECDSLDCLVYYQRVKYTAEADKVSSFQAVLASWEDAF